MLLGLLAPLVVVVQSARGEVRLPVRLDSSAGPVVAAPLLLEAVDGTITRGDGWVDVRIGGRTFRLFVGARLLAFDGAIEPLVGSAAIRRDTLELPLQFLAEVLPRVFADRFRYDRRQARLVDGRKLPLADAAPPTVPNDRLPNGLRKGHVVTLDAGHGGVDPGAPGRYFPAGITEKDITLDLALLTRDELRRRGVGVVLTRSRDTLIDLRSRGSYCTAECDLFVSIHVNALPRRRGYQQVRGFETYFLAEARTEDAARVERMENEAIRFETPDPESDPREGLDFMMRDLQLNEHLRESARAAELVQSYLQEAHTGPSLGVKQAGFMVLTTARRPAILIETGFATNPQDARLLTGRSSQRNLAASITDAIVAYLREYERKVGAGGISSGRTSSPAAGGQ